MSSNVKLTVIPHKIEASTYEDLQVMMLMMNELNMRSYNYDFPRRNDKGWEVQFFADAFNTQLVTQDDVGKMAQDGNLVESK